MENRFPELPWHEVVKRVEKCVFRLHCGQYAGTCFLIALASDQNSSESSALFATAWHVVADLVGSVDDIQLVSTDGKKVFGGKTHEIAFFPLGDEVFDTALIKVKTGNPVVKDDELLPVFPFDSVLRRGVDIGWVGFPGIVSSELCFFHGHISGYLNDPPTYLVDGVAINGVSGGPAFDNRAHLIGLVTAYIPNQVDQHTTLPGLMTVMPINRICYFVQHRMGAKLL